MVNRPREQLTLSVYHCGLRQKLITSTEGSFEICGTNCALEIATSIISNRCSPPPPKKKHVRRASVPDDADALPAQRHVMAPLRRVPALTLEHAGIGEEVLRHTKCLEGACSVDDDVCDDSATRARRGVLELDGVRAGRGVPRGAHDLGAAARVRAQPCAHPQRIPVRL